MSKRTTRIAQRSAVLVLVTLAASAAHAQTMFPEWASRSSRAWTGQPQLPGRVARFSRAQAPDGRLQDALLLCRVHVDGQWDLFADPDLQVRATLGRRSVEWWGSENSRTEMFSVAGVSLRPGDRLAFRIVDRDVTFDDFIRSVPGRYEGGPIVLTSGPARVECRHVPEPVVSAGRADALVRAAQELERLDAAEPDLAMDDLGRVAASTAPLVEAAAWAGWAHPEVAAARRLHLTAEERFEHAVARAMREARRTSPAPGEALEVPGGTVRVESLRCGRRAHARMLPEDRTTNACAIVVRLEGDAALGRADLLSADGTTVRPQIRYLDGEDIGLVVLAIPQRPRRTALLRFGAERHLIRVR
ncbi:MAG: hypothetical protein AB8I08_23095 [Sandaracinaceae bacterium]